MSSTTSVIEQQTRWARSKGFEPKNAYLLTLADNLRQQLSEGALTDFQRGSGRELRDREMRPARMRALSSAAALTANVFDYWRTRDRAPLQHAFGLRDRITRFSFEEALPTGLGTKPSTVDVLLTLQDDNLIAVESKFISWLIPRKRSMDASYFPRGEGLWAAHNLPRCQSLALAYREFGPYKFLDAPQLLKHALGLASKKPTRYEIYYIYFEWKSREGDAHAEELAKFSELVGEEVHFRALTYQQLFARLGQAIRPGDAGYLNYLTKRYAVDS